jgi:hypothetical protein
VLRLCYLFHDQRRGALIVGEHTEVHLGPAARGHLVVVGDRCPRRGRRLDRDDDGRGRLAAARVACRVRELVIAFKAGGCRVHAAPERSAVNGSVGSLRVAGHCDRIAVEVLVVGEHVEHAPRPGIEYVVASVGCGRRVVGGDLPGRGRRRAPVICDFQCHRHRVGTR